MRTSERKSRTRKSCNAVCAAASEYRNAAFSSHEDKDRAGPKRELLHCAVRFRVEQHRPPPSESFTTASSPILMAAAIVGPTTRFASTGTISFRIVPRNNDNSTKHHHSAMFSAVNDTLLPVRSRRGRDDSDASEKKLHVGEPAKQPRRPHKAGGGSARTASTAPARERLKLMAAHGAHHLGGRPTQERSKRSNGAPRNGKICPLCMI